MVRITFPRLSLVIGKWLGVLRFPSIIFRQEKGKGGLKEGAVLLTYAGLFVSLELFLHVFLITQKKMTMIFYFPMYLFVGITFAFFLWLIRSLMIYVVCALLNGKGKFGQQSYVFSLFDAPLYVLFYFFVVLYWIASGYGLGQSLIPFQFVSILLTLYWIYLTVLAIVEVHDFGKKKAVLISLIPYLIISISYYLKSVIAT